MQKKYVLTEDTIIWFSHVLHRICSLKDMPEINVKEGDLGGYVENENNLSHEGICWIFNEAKVYKNKVVSGNEQVYET